MEELNTTKPTGTTSSAVTESDILTFMTSSGKYFPASKSAVVKQRLERLTKDQLIAVSSAEYKDPTIVLLLSLFLGTFGIDRFMIGHVGIGFLKLLTAGLCGLFTIYDWFVILGKTKEENFRKFMELA